MKKILISLAILLALLPVLSPLAAVQAEENLAVQYQLNFGTGHANRWNLLLVAVTNKGLQDFSGAVEVAAGAGYEEEVFIAAGKTVEVTFLLPPFQVAGYFFDWTDERIQIHLKEKTGRVVKTVRVNTTAYPSELIAGVLAVSPEKFGLLESIFPGVKVVSLQEDYFSRFLFLDQFALLVVSDGGQIALNTEHKENLARWVAAGGVVIVGGGRGWQGNSALLPPELLPFEPEEVIEISGPLPFGGAASSGSFAVVTGDARGEVLLYDGSGTHPLLIAGDYGRGRVLYSALNLEETPFTDPAAWKGFWEYVDASLGERIYMPYHRQEKSNIKHILNIFSMGGRATFFLTPWEMFGGVVVYILLVGPGAYLVLRRLRRWEWGWISVPATAVLCTALLYLVAAGGRSGEYALHQINFIEMQQENRAVAESYGALFIPRRGKVAFSSSVSAMASGPGAVVERGTTPDSAIIRVDDPPLWSIQRLYAAQPLELEGTVKLQGTVGQNRMTALVTNATPYPFFDSYLRLGYAWQPVGPLAPGESKTVVLAGGGSLNLDRVLSRYARDGYHHIYWPEEMFDHNWDLLFAGFNDSMPVIELLGAAHPPPLNVFITGLEMPELAVEEAFSFREGWLKPRVFSSASRSYSSAAPYPSGAYRSGYPLTGRRELYLTGTEQADLVYALPSGIDYSRGEYKLNFSLHGFGSGEILVYNASRNEWEKLDDMSFGYNRVYTLQNVQDLVDGGRLRLRLKLLQQGEVICELGSLLSIEGGAAP